MWEKLYDFFADTNVVWIWTDQTEFDWVPSSLSCLLLIAEENRVVYPKWFQFILEVSLSRFPYNSSPQLYLPLS